MTAAPAPSASPATDPVAVVLTAVGSSPDGLSTDEARRRLDTTGPNEPARRPRHRIVREFAALLANPLVVILLVASAVSAALGEAVNAAIIAAMVVLSVVLNVIQTSRSQRAAERLRDEAAPTATVVRDGQWGERPRRELVPGDVIRLAAGDRVPADARLLTARDLHVQQAALTGESLPVEKEAAPASGAASVPAPSAKGADPSARNLVFLGTSVVSGIATAVVTATG